MNLAQKTSQAISHAVANLYSNTVETRHALVHRRITVDPSSNDLTGYCANGTALTPLTKAEQLAFARVSQRLAQAISEQTQRPRLEADLRGLLSTLQRHHTIQELGRAATRSPERVGADFPEGGVLDVPEIMALAIKTFPGVSYVDLELRLPNGHVAEAELESAPQVVVTIDPDALPAWLKLK